MEFKNFRYIFAKSNAALFIKGIFGYFLAGSVDGLVVSIAGFQAIDPGSIPGRRRLFPNFLQNLCSLGVG